MEILVHVTVESSDATVAKGVANIAILSQQINRTFAFEISRPFQKDVAITITKDGRPFVEVKDGAIKETVARIGAAERVILFVLIQPIMDALRSDGAHASSSKRTIRESSTQELLRQACA